MKVKIFMLMLAEMVVLSSCSLPSVWRDDSKGNVNGNISVVSPSVSDWIPKGVVTNSSVITPSSIVKSPQLNNDDTTGIDLAWEGF